VVVLPLSLVDHVAICVDQLSLALHLAPDPVAEVVAAVVVDVFAPAVPEGVLLLAVVAVPVGVYLAGLYVGPVF
jgi:hypothetical protein